MNDLSLFGGEITASSVVAQAHAEARAGAAKGDISGSTVTDLVALGAPVTGNAAQLADWGSLTTVAGGASGTACDRLPRQRRRRSRSGSRPITAASWRERRSSSATRKSPPKRAPPEPVVPGPKPSQVKAGGTKSSSRAPEPAPGFPPVRQPPDVTPKLTAGGYVFPVYGPSSFTDTFGSLAETSRAAGTTATTSSPRSARPCSL